MKKEKPLDEDLVIAVLHCIGENRIDDKVATTVFGQAAKDHPKLFGKFSLHLLYQDCPKLDNIVSLLFAGGCAYAFSNDPHAFYPSSRTAGGYGKSKLEMFSKKKQEIIKEVAAKLGTDPAG